MDIVQKAIVFAKKEYQKNDPKHRWPHIEAVMQRAMDIAHQLKNVDVELLKLSVIFHDIDYHSETTYKENYQNHVENSIATAEKFLRENKYPENRIRRIKRIMLDHSTPHRKIRGESKIIEGKILYDADKSIGMAAQEKYEKYYPLLYLDETKQLVEKKA